MLRILDVQYKNCNSSEDLLQFVNQLDYKKYVFTCFHGGDISIIWIVCVDLTKGVIHYYLDEDLHLEREPTVWKIKEAEEYNPHWAFPLSISATNFWNS